MINVLSILYSLSLVGCLCCLSLAHCWDFPEEAKERRIALISSIIFSAFTLGNDFILLIVQEENEGIVKYFVTLMAVAAFTGSIVWYNKAKFKIVKDEVSVSVNELQDVAASMNVSLSQETVEKLSRIEDAMLQKRIPYKKQLIIRNVVKNFAETMKSYKTMRSKKEASESDEKFFGEIASNFDMFISQIDFKDLSAEEITFLESINQIDKNIIKYYNN